MLALIGHFEEEQAGYLFYIVTITDPVTPYF
jgi:hypothetical protein